MAGRDSDSAALRTSRSWQAFWSSCWSRSRSATGTSAHPHVRRDQPHHGDGTVAAVRVRGADLARPRGVLRSGGLHIGVPRRREPRGSRAPRRSWLRSARRAAARPAEPPAQGSLPRHGHPRLRRDHAVLLHRGRGRHRRFERASRHPAGGHRPLVAETPAAKYLLVWAVAVRCSCLRPTSSATGRGARCARSTARRWAPRPAASTPCASRSRCSCSPRPSAGWRACSTRTTSASSRPPPSRSTTRSCWSRWSRSEAQGRLRGDRGHRAAHAAAVRGRHHPRAAPGRGRVACRTGRATSTASSSSS